MEAFLERNPDYFKLYYKKNRDKLNQYHDKWTQNNKKHLQKYQKIYHKKYYQKNKFENHLKIGKTKTKQKNIEKMLKLNEEKAAAFKASLHL